MRMEVIGGIARLLIDQPLKRNAMNTAMFESIPGLVAEAEGKKHVRAILLTSARAGLFCAGADIGELSAHAGDPAWRGANQRAINAAQLALARADRPTVAFVDGDCVGGGCGMALACDIRVGTLRARFGITPAKLGLVYPLHDTKLLVDLVGPGQAKRILYTGDLIGAEEALRIGLIDLIADHPDDLLGSIAGNSLHSQRQSKHIVRRILDGQAADDAETLAMFAEAFEGPDFREGVAAFLGKRKADFK
ncbi:enoyl-CoA hydratase/isomerase family protein [Sphingomonas sp. SUN039]|uniref:enoyl-CoA hydratase/isomerase family protein n=1 Tax=Sphingomonas sp. SUN039 TaxID=2937787 RepID=UPI0021642D35|nr:enoyl-CoA hydratase-related protein [Sphingomonas sp. SUN039]UVO55910.1 enoyl-CoA hydratase-related protein [Sphingomonas sp. SUN039]